MDQLIDIHIHAGGEFHSERLIGIDDDRLVVGVEGGAQNDGIAVEQALHGIQILFGGEQLGKTGCAVHSRQHRLRIGEEAVLDGLRL